MQRSASLCLDELTLQSLATGRLDGEKQAEAEVHLADCPSCARALNQLASSLERFAADAPESGVSQKAGSTATQATRLSSDLSSRSDSPAPGTIIGQRYRVERWLGHGGMGSVVAATHIGLEQRVAIKVLRLHSPESAARFIREGRTLAQLCSEHIVRVYDSGQLPNGTPYIVMEHLAGIDLAEVSKDGPLEIRDVVGYVRQACEALGTAHSAGIVHRDLKPSNLFLTQLGGEPCIKVLDFGISKNVVASSGSTPEGGALSLTGTGDVLGSPRYMSPEQLHGSRALDQRTDIWSLGVILYELLTGQAPFSQPAFAAMAIAIATEPPIAPRQLRPDIPKALEAIILRCMEKAPEQRFASAGELSAILQPFESSNPQEFPSVAPEIGSATTQPVPRPRRRRAWTLGVLALALASILLWLQWRSSAPSEEASRDEPAQTHAPGADPSVEPEQARTPALQPTTATPAREPPPPAVEPASPDPVTPVHEPTAPPPEPERASVKAKRRPPQPRPGPAEVQPASSPEDPASPPRKRIEGLSATPD